LLVVCKFFACLRCSKPFCIQCNYWINVPMKVFLQGFPQLQLVFLLVF